MVSGVYAISTPSGRLYIGSSIDIAKRWRRHRSELTRKVHSNKFLQRAFDKYGERLSWSIMAICETANVLATEQEFIDATPRELQMNLAAYAGGGSGSHTDESRSKIAASKRGKKHSAETRAKIAKAKQFISEETRAKIRVARKKQIITPESRTRAGLAARGRIESYATRAQKSANNLKRTYKNSTGYRGVRANGGGWAARLNHQGDRRHIGTYGTPELAYAMRLVYLAALPPGGI